MREWIFFDYLKADSACLLRCLRRYSNLAPLVRTLVFSGETAEPSLDYVEDDEEDDEYQEGEGEREGEGEDAGEQEIDGVETFFSTLSMFSNLEVIILDDPCDFDLIDKELYSRQIDINRLAGDRPLPPIELNLTSLRLLQRESFSGEEGDYSLFTAYSTLRITPRAAYLYHAPLPDFAVAQLRTLSIPLSRIDLSNLPHLERLELTLDNEYSNNFEEWYTTEDVEWLSGTVSKTIKALPNSLETVILTHSAGYDELFPVWSFPVDDLAQQLKSSLVSLSIENGFCPPNLARFVSDLSPSSKLQRLNISPTPKRKEAARFEAECEKRGIIWSYNEVWEI